MNHCTSEDEDTKENEMSRVCGTHWRRWTVHTGFEWFTTVHWWFV